VGVPRPGDIVTAEITYAAPHHLVADRVLAVRRTRAGDAAQAARTGRPAGVMLGLPTLRP
jgi:tRNA-2-methylthio-N6-dimethylallyladenosine synthase